MKPRLLVTPINDHNNITPKLKILYCNPINNYDPLRAQRMGLWGGGEVKEKQTGMVITI